MYREQYIFARPRFPPRRRLAAGPRIDWVGRGPLNTMLIRCMCTRRSDAPTLREVMEKSKARPRLRRCNIAIRSQGVLCLVQSFREAPVAFGYELQLFVSVVACVAKACTACDVPNFVFPLRTDVPISVFPLSTMLQFATLHMQTGACS